MWTRQEDTTVVTKGDTRPRFLSHTGGETVIVHHNETRSVSERHGVKGVNELLSSCIDGLIFRHHRHY